MNTRKQATEQAYMRALKRGRMIYIESPEYEEKWMGYIQCDSAPKYSLEEYTNELLTSPKSNCRSDGPFTCSICNTTNLSHIFVIYFEHVVDDSHFTWACCTCFSVIKSTYNTHYEEHIMCSLMTLARIGIIDDIKYKIVKLLGVNYLVGYDDLD